MYNDINSLPESSLGERVRKSRLLQNLTIKELSKKACMSAETISNIEKSRTTPNINSLLKLSQALNTNNIYLLGTDSWPEETQGQIIYKYRMILGLSQEQLAKKCSLHKSTIQDYENNILSNPDTLKIIYTKIGYI
ncbi:helix-turn-helix transcriptional regulator [Tissierella sp. MB52-C2]|uniref:helix-turn-helix domain-containing protein n=1 Tax=Tissierella sp. MB52-C2 TaxID=3070999 RepID=UPI00280BBC24|nr:helix-turn-helix transcriptional regulator [Tissierella sp. MB52-C2]WMM26633.1 helix-turn-helix transcriptional regulator [Tissierella sp. MB52-C2]